MHTITSHTVCAREAQADVCAGSNQPHELSHGCMHDVPVCALAQLPLATQKHGAMAAAQVPVVRIGERVNGAIHANSRHRTVHSAKLKTDFRKISFSDDGSGSLKKVAALNSTEHGCRFFESVACTVRFITFFLLIPNDVSNGPKSKWQIIGLAMEIRHVNVTQLVSTL